MSTKSAIKQWTDDELMALPRDGNKYELVNGELAVSPTGMEHGHVSSAISNALRTHVSSKRLGAVLESSTGFRMKSSNVLSPDVSFVGKDRLEGLDRLPERFFEGAPDLVVEVLSPSDTLLSAQRKLNEYFANGTQMCWIVDPRTKTVRAYEPQAAPRLLREEDTLEGDPVLPGFILRGRDIFAPTWK